VELYRETDDGPQFLRKAIDWKAPYHHRRTKVAVQADRRRRKLKEAATVLAPRRQKRYQEPKYEQAIAKMKDGASPNDETYFSPQKNK
jgi:hypothetical protein